MSHNRMSSLPTELTELTQLESVDISYNSFISLPQCLFRTQRLAKINAKKNFITGKNRALNINETRCRCHQSSSRPAQTPDSRKDLFCFGRFWNVGTDGRTDTTLKNSNFYRPCLWVSLVDQQDRCHEWSSWPVLQFQLIRSIFSFEFFLRDLEKSDAQTD